MKKLLAIFLIATLPACASFSKKTNSFPDLPPKLMEAPAPLKTIVTPDKDASIVLSDTSNSNIPLSSITKIITDNYKTCNAYREQIFGLQDWLTQQKRANP